MRQAKPDTHQLCRSLLQKAVRRGCLDLVEITVNHLDQIGDRDWLKKRTAVITYEECWPLGNCFFNPPTVEEIIKILESTCNSIKNKNAAGLGSLAYEFSKGDRSMMSGTETDEPILRIASAIQSPQPFWERIQNNVSNEVQGQIVNSAFKSYRRGGWPWDRAFMQAAAYLSISAEIPVINKAQAPLIEVDQFPFWIAIDKHTDIGKKALKELATKKDIKYQALGWINFYFEGALTNQTEYSYWWEREKTWRFHKLGLSLSSAQQIWDEVRQDYISIVEEESSSLREHILNSENSTTQNQLSLFS